MSICIMLNPQDHLGSLLRTPTPRSPTWVALTSWPWYKANLWWSLILPVSWIGPWVSKKCLEFLGVRSLKSETTHVSKNHLHLSYLSIFRSMHSTSSIPFLSFISIRSPCFCYPLPRCRCSPKAVSVVNLAAANHAHHNFTHPSTLQVAQLSGRSAWFWPKMPGFNKFMKRWIHKEICGATRYSDSSNYPCVRS